MNKFAVKVILQDTRFGINVYFIRVYFLVFVTLRSRIFLIIFDFIFSENSLHIWPIFMLACQKLELDNRIYWIYKHNKQIVANDITPYQMGNYCNSGDGKENHEDIYKKAEP